MYKNRYAKRMLAVLLGIVTALASASMAYAFTGGQYHDFRDNEISFYLPDDWTTEEVDAEDSEGEPYECILKARGEAGDGMLYLRVYYTSGEPLEDDYIYIDDEGDAEEYYDNYGMAVLDALYEVIPEAGTPSGERSFELPEPDFFKGEWNGFLVSNISGVVLSSDTLADYYHTVYQTPHMTDDSANVVHNFLIFYNDSNTPLTEEQAKLAREVADEFYDYGYYNVMMGIDTDDSLFDGSDNSDGEDMEIVWTILGVIVILAPIVIVVFAVIFLVRRAGRRGGKNFRVSAIKDMSRKLSGEINQAQQTFNLEESIGNWKKRRAERDSFSGREQRAEKRTQRREEWQAVGRENRRAANRVERRSTVQMRNREAESAEQRYYASLQTLHKTGLLTKEEMRDMLERHERSRARQRKH